MGSWSRDCIAQPLPSQVNQVHPGYRELATKKDLLPIAYLIYVCDQEVAQTRDRYCAHLDPMKTAS